ncbi:purine-nucleoside phosphorylase [Blattabacterium cuenoti]|uniref:purine-nucleoside phosphorylase n=1 Tax=Blattabacterium cuenoti TaxID=1653831 RepID=UPI00163CEFE2|nr:purine-nucleoside phosphorylase [Blattabacterium cuenoti]
MSVILTLEKSKQYIQKKIKEKPDFGILLLGNQFDELIEEIRNPICILYEEIPLFSKKKLCGKFLFGKIEDKNVVFLIEPFYEEKITYNFSIVLCKNIGIDKLILINISGGINPNYKTGDVMLVKDHINFFPENINIKKEFLKNRFFEVTEPYDKKMIEIAENIAMNHNIIIQKGVYVAYPYPNYKTSAEYAMIRSIGGDSVGMNIVTDVMTARCMNIRVFAISIVMGLYEKAKDNKTHNLYDADSLNPFSKEMEKSISLLILIIREFIKLCL